jgi:hypothetical protein
LLAGNSTRVGRTRPSPMAVAGADNDRRLSPLSEPWSESRRCRRVRRSNPACGSATQVQMRRKGSTPANTALPCAGLIGLSCIEGVNVMARIVRVPAGLLALVAMFGILGGVALAAGGSSSSSGSGGAGSSASGSGVSSSGSGAPSISPGSPSPPVMGGGSGSGSLPTPGKRKSVEDGLRQTGNAPSPAQDKQELRTLNQISRQTAPGVPVPAPEVSH